MPAAIPVQTITTQSLQGKRMSPDDYREHSYMCRLEEVDIDAKLSRLCEQDKVVRIREDKLQQLHREKVKGLSPCCCLAVSIHHVLHSTQQVGPICSCHKTLATW